MLPKHTSISKTANGFDQDTFATWKLGRGLNQSEYQTFRDSSNGFSFIKVHYADASSSGYRGKRDIISRKSHKCNVWELSRRKVQKITEKTTGKVTRRLFSVGSMLNTYGWR